MRISMHPDQFVVINSPNAAVVESSVRELRYHAEVLDLMGLDLTAKIQIHGGGVYGDRPAAWPGSSRDSRRSTEAVRRRLVVENDDRCYTLADCLALSAAAGVPVLFDAFHHRIHNRGEDPAEALRLAPPTWTNQDGLPMVDYSQQAPGERAGQPRRHPSTSRHFARFLRQPRPLDFDIMLEIKDKEKSAIRAVQGRAAIRASSPRPGSNRWRSLDPAGPPDYHFHRRFQGRRCSLWQVQFTTATSR